jgi:CBS domain-containing protein
MATKVADVMTDRPRAVTKETTIREAARLMGEEDVGALPIVGDSTRLVGIVTDRDIAVRAIGRGLDPEQTSVGQIASAEVYVLTPDDDLDDALETMARAQVRRIPVVVRENELVGMISQADIARAGKDKNTGEVVEAISRPRRGPRIVGGETGGGSTSTQTETHTQDENEYATRGDSTSTSQPDRTNR